MREVTEELGPIAWVVVETSLVLEAEDDELPGLRIDRVVSAHESHDGAQLRCRTLAREAGDAVAMYHVHPVRWEP